MNARGFSLAIVLAGCAAIAACSGGAGDPTTTPTPTPTQTPTVTPSPSPSPTAFAADRCWLRWTTSNPTGKVSSYLVDLPAATWLAGGTASYGVDVTAVFMHDSDGTYVGSTAVAFPMSGDFQVSADGFLPGATVTFSDAASQPYERYDVDLGGVTGEVIANGGTGTFTGTWTDPLVTDPGEFVPGTGAILVAFGTTNLSLGTTRAVGQCYQVSLLR